MRIFLILLTAAALLLPSGCGYRLLGSGKPGCDGFLMGSVDDLTREPLFGPLLRASLSSAMVERGCEGDVTLDVTLKGFKNESKAFVAGDFAREYLLSVTADFTLKRGEKTLAKETGIEAWREYYAGEDVNATNANRDKALRDLADTAADKIIRRASIAVGLGR
jgi:outer membrane lipopolysaccharide assembly protein LptE/RlpB